MEFHSNRYYLFKEITRASWDKNLAGFSRTPHQFKKIVDCLKEAEDIIFRPINLEYSNDSIATFTVELLEPILIPEFSITISKESKEKISEITDKKKIKYLKLKYVK